MALLIFLIYEVLVWFGASWILKGTDLLVIGFVMTALGTTVLVVYFMVTRRFPQQAASSAAQREPAIAAPLDSPSLSRQDEDTDDLMALLAEANTRLASSRIKTGVRNLPLLLLVGPAKTGKTSAFINSGLEPELLAGQVSGDPKLSSPSLCNFWFVGQTLFAEPSSQLYSGELRRWTRVLGVLAKRSVDSLLRNAWSGVDGGRTFRGVAVFCDIANFRLSPDPHRLSALARSYQERLRAVGEVFGKDFPAYVLFTKCDEMPYFGEYFSNLSEAEEQQILGATLLRRTDSQGEVYAEAETRRLSGSFENLYCSLAGKRLDFLSRETARSKKRQFVYEYPREMKRVQNVLVQFLVDVFRPNPLQPGPWLRGYYFTGVRRVAARTAALKADRGKSVEPKPSDATTLFQAKDLEGSNPRVNKEATGVRETSADRWCFVSELFNRVILADRVAPEGGYVNRRAKLYRQIALGSLAALFMLLSVLFIRSWFLNLELLRDVEQVARSAPTTTAGSQVPSIESLRDLDQLRQKAALLSSYQREGAPWRLRWGLYVGSGVLPLVRDLYFERFRGMLLQPILTSIKANLTQRNQTDNFATVRDQLKAYFMMTSGKCKADKSFLTPILFDTWHIGHPADEKRDDLARLQIEFYANELEHKNPYRIEEEAKVRESAQAYLSQGHGMERYYGAILEKVKTTLTGPVKLADLVSHYRETLTGPAEINPAFTQKGWSLVQQELKSGNLLAFGDDCLSSITSPVGQVVQGEQLKADIKAQYFKDHAAIWKALLGNTKVTRFQNPDDAAQRLKLLADNRSPLLGLLFLTAENTSISGTADSAGVTQALTPPGGILDRILPSRVREAGSKVQAVASQIGSTALPDTPKIFQPVHVVVPPSSKDRWINDTNKDYFDSLGRLQLAMQSLAQSGPSNTSLTLNEDARRAAEAARQAVRQIKQKFNISDTEGVDNAVVALLEAPIDDSVRFVNTNPAQPLNAGLAGLCSKFRVLTAKYPFNPQSDREVSAQELSEFFSREGGALWTFHRDHLSSIIARPLGRYVQSPETQGPRLTPEFLEFFNRLASISNALFPEGGNRPRTAYALRTVPSENIQHLALDIDGETLASSGKQSASKQFVWPGSSGTQQVSLKVTAGAAVFTFASYDGMWGVFKMMRNADLRAPGGKVVEFSKVRQGSGRPEPVTLENGTPVIAKLEIAEFPGGVDAFDRGFFTGIRCPSRAAP